MLIVFTAKGKSWDSLIDPRFGRTDYLLQYDDEKDTFKELDNRDNENFAHGVGPKTVQKLYDFGADVLITGNGPGGNAAVLLAKTGVKTYVGAGKMTVRVAYEAYKQNKLEEFEY